MYFIDTHVHLNDKVILNHLEEVVNDALNEDVKMFFIVGWDKESSIKAIELAKNIPNAYAIIGFHPCNVRGLTDEDYKWLEDAGKLKEVVAIGEIGFDFHWKETTKEEQTYALLKQIEIAKRLNKPISVHSRDAIQLTYDVLKETNIGQVGGVIHSFSGSFEMAKEFIKLGFILGISGPVTFKNGKNAKEVVEGVDIKYLVSETDSPYLTPTPYRGKENGPKYIPLIVKEIAMIKGLAIEDVKEHIYNNTKRVFNI